MIKKPMMAKRTTKAAPAKKKTVAAKKKTVAAKKPMTVAGKTVKKYQVGGPAMGSPRANPTATVGMQRPTITPGMTAPQMRQAYGQSAGMNRAEAQRRNASMPTPAARPGMASRPGMGGGLIPNNAGSMGGGLMPPRPGIGGGMMPPRPGIGGGMMPPPNSRPNVPGITPPMNRPVRTPPPRQGMPQGMDPAMQQYAQMMQQRQGMQGMQGMGAAQGMNPDRQVSFLPGTPPEMRQQYQRQLEQSMQGMQGQRPPMMQGMQGLGAAQGMQQGRGVPSQISDLYGGQRQGMQGMSAARGMDPEGYARNAERLRRDGTGMNMGQPMSPQERQMLGLQSDPAMPPMPQGMQGMDPKMHPDYQSPETIDLRDPAMAARYGHLGRGPQPLTQEQLQQLQQFGTPLQQLGQPLNQAPARFRKGGEAKKKAAAQGRMAKPAGRGRTTKPAVRGRMAKPTRGKK